MSKIDPTRSGMLCANGGPKRCRVCCDACKKVFQQRQEESTGMPFPKKRKTIGVQTFTIDNGKGRTKKEAMWYKKMLKNAFDNLKK